MNFVNLPTEIQSYILDFLMYTCNDCNNRFFYTMVHQCSYCKQYTCKDHAIEQLNSYSCEKCFRKQYQSYIDDLESLFSTPCTIS